MPKKSLDPALERVVLVGSGIAARQRLDHRLEGLALDVAHHEVVAAGVVDAHLVAGGDVGMLELAGDADLLGEAEDELVGRFADEALQGDRAIDVVVVDERDLAEPTATEQAYGREARTAGRPLGHGAVDAHEAREDRRPHREAEQVVRATHAW